MINATYGPSKEKGLQVKNEKKKILPKFRSCLPPPQLISTLRGINQNPIS